MSFDLSYVFGGIYPIVPLIAFIGFCPQLFFAYKAQSALKSISILTWLIWLGSWCIAFGYSALTIKDPMLTFTAGLNIVTHVMLIGVIVFKRMKYAEIVILPAGLEINAGVNIHINQIADEVHDQRYQCKEIERSKHNGIIAIDDALIAEQAKAIEAEDHLYQ